MVTYLYKKRQHGDGFAIVIVLAAIVLLVGVVLAFFSNALQQKQISQSSGSRVKTDLLIDGATNIIVSDLKAEIEAGSLDAVDAGVDKLFVPTTSENMVPELAGSTGKNGLEVLVKRSNTAEPAYTGGTNRASSVSTQTPSLDGRFISKSRWNKPLFLAPTSAADHTPASADFVAPDWVYMSRDGSTPVAWNADMVTSRENDGTVVGRFAYAIYDEGATLDVNAAGAPADVPAGEKSRKTSLAYADLTGIFVAVGFNSSRSAEIADQIIQWRNVATLATGSADYDRWASYNPQGFMMTANTTLHQGSLSDRIFTSRQQLQRFLLEKVATPAEKDRMLLALNYLSSFTRDLNQPSFIKPQAVNAALPGYSTTAPKIKTVSNGGNNQDGMDAFVNPAFPLVRVQKTFVRNDGSSATVGEPLVKNRFALARLSWLTYKGPSASRDESDADMQTLINTHHIPSSFLKKGTAENIRKHFGLRWQPDTDSELGRWIYDVHNGPASTGPT